MPHLNINLLSTRPLHEDLINAAANRRVRIDAISFIETEETCTGESKKIIKDLSGIPIIAIFTSMNAVTVVTKILDGEQPPWKIFCIGAATKKLIAGFFGDQSVAGTAMDATSLAKVMIEKKITSAVFFCGDQRRDEMPGILRAHNIVLQEIEVYKTIELHHQVTKPYDGILFFSPSAVHSFFSTNPLPLKTIFFAIGSTTSRTLQSYSANDVIVSEYPEKDLLVNQAIDYFTKDQ